MSHSTTLKAKADVTLEGAVKRILRTFDRATASDVEAGASWYADAGRIAASLVGPNVTLEQATAVVAHLSPRTDWARNVAGAISLVTTGTAPGCIGANVSRAIDAMVRIDPLVTFNGPKTRRFYLNILGDREAVTVDVWAARVAGVTEQQLTRKGVYDALEEAYRVAARRRGVDPTTMQATTWVVARNGRSK